MAETDADPATESELSLTDGCVRQSRRGLSLISEPHRMGILERYYSEGANAQPMPLDTLVLGAHTKRHHRKDTCEFTMLQRPVTHRHE
jgi:hypothetical protein